MTSIETKRLASRADSRATTRLIHDHPDEYREAYNDEAQYGGWRNGAQTRARIRVKDHHRDDYDRYYQQERVKLGLRSTTMSRT